MLSSSIYLFLNLLAYFDQVHLCEESLVYACSSGVMVVLSSMALQGIDFGALTQTHLLFQQFLLIRLLLIWSLSPLKKIWRSGLTGEVPDILYLFHHFIYYQSLLNLHNNFLCGMNLLNTLFPPSNHLSLLL